MSRPGGRADRMKDEIVALRERGLTQGQICLRLDLPKASVNHHLAMAGMVGRPQAGDDEIEELRLQGLSTAEIGRQIGRAPNTVGRRLAIIAGYKARQEPTFSQDDFEDL